MRNICDPEYYNGIQKEALICFNNHVLTEYLKTLNDDDIIRLFSLICYDDILGPWEDILETIMQESEYRNDEKKLNNANKTGFSL